MEHLPDSLAAISRARANASAAAFDILTTKNMTCWTSSTRCINLTGSQWTTPSQVDNNLILFSGRHHTQGQRGGPRNQTSQTMALTSPAEHKHHNGRDKGNPQDFRLKGIPFAGRPHFDHTPPLAAALGAATDHTRWCCGLTVVHLSSSYENCSVGVGTYKLIVELISSKFSSVVRVLFVAVRRSFLCLCFWDSHVCL